MTLRRIERELDIAYFIKNQIIFNNLIKAITTKRERSIAKQNFRLVVNLT